MEKNYEPNPKLDLLTAFGLNLGDASRLCKFAINEAKKQTEGARVGCAVLTKKGHIHLGQLVKDPLGTGISAEDFAVFKAVSEGDEQIKGMCVHYIGEDGTADYTWPQGRFLENL